MNDGWCIIMPVYPKIVSVVFSWFSCMSYRHVTRSHNNMQRASPFFTMFNELIGELITNGATPSWNYTNSCQCIAHTDCEFILGYTGMMMMFNKVLNIPTHVLHPLLPPPNSTQPYTLRTRAHNRTLPQRKSHLVDCNFIMRMLYWNAY